MQTLLPIAALVADLLETRKETLGVAESSTGGLICATLLAIPGASAYFVGGGVIYTAKAQRALLDIPRDELASIRASTEAYALIGARTIRARLATTWGLAETGATGPSGNPYGDAPGHSCIAIAGAVDRAITLETGRSDRVQNMRAFTKRALEMLVEVLS
jgi:PncC family amidohydrolase